MKILIADDEPENLYLISFVLSNRGYQVFQASNGKQAWELIEKENIPLVLTDWMMPMMDGVELVRRIRSADFPYYTYIILMTARNTKRDEVDGLEAGADDYLAKPYDADELLVRLSIAERIINLESQLRLKTVNLQELALKDSLTGLYNRRAISEQANSEIARGLRENLPVSAVMIDLDHFKLVNDRYGHAVGDRALCFAADIIADHKRPYDHVGRWGGEEFLLVLPGIDMIEATKIAERMRSLLSSSRLDLPTGEKLAIHASFGVASAGSDAKISFDELVRRADLALYQAKTQGRNRVCMYHPENDQG